MPDDTMAAAVTISVSGAIAKLRISNPGKRNAFTWGMYEQLRAACQQVNADPTIRVAVVHGDTADGFAAGTDITQFVDFRSEEEGLAYEDHLAGILRTVAEVSVPTIAMVHGDAIGGGLAVAAMCDIIVAEQGARFGAPVARTLGNCLPIAVVHRLRSRLGIGIATSMLLTARLFKAEDLVGAGFVSQVVARADLETVVDGIAARVASEAPLTLRAFKEMGQRLDEQSAPPAADDLLALCYGSNDFQEGVSAFVQRRPPEWSGQ
jgi:enoyl-CoA hydratase/carnithine racemase